LECARSKLRRACPAEEAMVVPEDGPEEADTPVAEVGTPEAEADTPEVVAEADIRAGVRAEGRIPKKTGTGLSPPMTLPSLIKCWTSSP